MSTRTYPPAIAKCRLCRIGHGLVYLSIFREESFRHEGICAGIMIFVVKDSPSEVHTRQRVELYRSTPEMLYVTTDIPCIAHNNRSSREMIPHVLVIFDEAMRDCLGRGKV